MFYLKNLLGRKCNIKNSEKISYLEKKLLDHKYNTIKIFEKILHWEKLLSRKCNIKNLEKTSYFEKKFTT